MKGGQTATDNGKYITIPTGSVTSGKTNCWQWNSRHLTNRLLPYPRRGTGPTTGSAGMLCCLPATDEDEGS